MYGIPPDELPMQRNEIEYSELSAHERRELLVCHTCHGRGRMPGEPHYRCEDCDGTGLNLCDDCGDTLENCTCKEKQETEEQQNEEQNKEHEQK